MYDKIYGVEFDQMNWYELFLQECSRNFKRYQRTNLDKNCSTNHETMAQIRTVIFQYRQKSSLFRKDNNCFKVYFSDQIQFIWN